jgi:hypothetical protein
MPDTMPLADALARVKRLKFGVYLVRGDALALRVLIEAVERQADALRIYADVKQTAETDPDGILGDWAMRLLGIHPDDADDALPPPPGEEPRS